MIQFSRIGGLPEGADIENLFVELLPTSKVPSMVPSVELAPGLSLIPSIKMSDDTGLCVSYKVAELLGLDADNLLGEALMNSEKVMPHKITRLVEEASEMPGLPVPNEGMASVLVVSNEYGMGASAIAYPGVIEELTERFPDGFYVLPSSVHEVLILPVDTEHPEDWMIFESMLLLVNDHTTKKQGDWLSDTLYRYDPETNWFGLASEYRKENK